MKPTIAVIVVVLSYSTSWSILESQAQGQAGYVGLTQPQVDALENNVRLIRERGVVESASMVEFRAAIGSTIVAIEPEGSTVKSGDILLRLDSTALKDEIAAQSIKLSEAQNLIQSDFIKVKSVRNERTTAAVFAKQANEVAKLRLETFVGNGGESDMILATLQDQLEAAKKKLAAFGKAKQYAAEMVKQGKASVIEIANIEAQVAQAQAELSIIKRKMQFQESQNRLRTAELQFAIVQQDALASTKNSAFELKLIQTEAELAAARTAATIEESKLANLQEQLTRCTVKATRDGVLLYRNGAAGRRNSPSMSVGTKVSGRQPLVAIADMSSLRVATLVNETRIGRIEIGQPATIRVDALPNRVIEGKVEKINRFPEPTSFLDSNVKKYRVLVSIKDAVPQLRIGMTALVEIK